MDEYETFTGRYVILNGSIDKGKKLQVTHLDAVMSPGTVHEWTLFSDTAAILNYIVFSYYEMLRGQGSLFEFAILVWSSTHNSKKKKDKLTENSI